MDFLHELRHRLPDETYLVSWFSRRADLQPWPAAHNALWSVRTARAVQRWVHLSSDQKTPPLDRQELRLFEQTAAGEVSLAEAANYLTQLYPEQSVFWELLAREDSPDENHRRVLIGEWNLLRRKRTTQERDRHRAAALPEFHRALWERIRKLADAEAAIASLLTDRSLGWDLDEGDWDSLDFSPLLKAAQLLEGEPALRRIAELLGRDYRARTRPPELPPAPPSNDTELEPGKTEIRGIRFGSEWNSALSSEQALLAFPETSDLFFKKSAEDELLVWDHFTPIPPPSKDRRTGTVRQSRNERGPVIIVLDTSGSMRGKPEEVAKTIVLALTRVCLEEQRACYLINFSAQIRTLEVTDLQKNLPALLSFLEFSFHGGTDLPPALKEAMRVLDQGRFREADVLVISDFAVPKVPGPVRRVIRDQQESQGTRFFSLTVSMRPLNDFLNIFDASWVYNIHPSQTQGITLESFN